MNTDQLIDMLARDLRAVDPRLERRRLLLALGVGAAFSLGLTLALFGLQPGLEGGIPDAAFLVKAAYGATLASLLFVMASTLVQPGAAMPSWQRLSVPIGGLAVLAAVELASSPASQWENLLFGASWSRCPLRIAALSLPFLAALVIVARRQAPTRLRRTGAVVGAAAGSAAAIIYALACTETSAVFVLVWYTLGIALATAIGAAIGPRLLRW